MLGVFTELADWLTSLTGLDLETRFGQAVHFFIEDVTKIFVLIYVLIFIISLFRSQLSPEKVRIYLSGKSKWAGYFLAVFLGVVTPFCSCSSIPLFMGFLAAGVPFGVSMAFLVSSPLISEIAAIMLLAMGTTGIYIVVLYIISGTLISVLAGYLADKFKIERFLAIKIPNVTPPTCTCKSIKEKAVALIKYAHNFATDTIKSLALYILIGLVIGAFMHGYIPQELFIRYLGKDNIFAVPVAAIIGIPMYASQAGIVPIMQVLLMKGVPVGTALVMFMSIATISLPEMMMLKRVFTYKLLAMFIGYLLTAFIITGYMLNLI
ncbi:MAG: permease [Azospirillum sp.]|nr:permease [Azospirillum sp.]